MYYKAIWTFISRLALNNRLLEGEIWIINDEDPEKMEVRFLNQVDLSQCKNNKIQVKILNMQRTRAIDYSSEKEEKREFLVYMCDWLAYNWLGNQIAVRSHIEGKHQELTKQLVTKMDNENGRVNAYYVKGPISNSTHNSLHQKDS